MGRKSKANGGVVNDEEEEDKNQYDQQGKSKRYIT